jgi:hypothetical protein
MDIPPLKMKGAPQERVGRPVWVGGKDLLYNGTAACKPFSLSAARRHDSPFCKTKTFTLNTVGRIRPGKMPSTRTPEPDRQVFSEDGPGAEVAQPSTQELFEEDVMLPLSTTLRPGKQNLGRSILRSRAAMSHSVSRVARTCP